MTPCLSEESLQAYLDGELALDASNDVAAHLADCAGCAASARRAEQTLAVLASALDNELPAVIPTTRLRANIESALGESATPEFTVIPLLGRVRHWSNWRLATVTTGILILISAIVILWRSESLLKAKREGPVVLPTPVNTPGPQTPPQKLAEPPVGRDQVVTQQPEKRQRRVRRQASRNELEEVEVVTRFFPLIEGDDFSSFKGNQIVRVEMAGLALLAIGLPVDGEMRNRSVKADIVLRHDGLARAIRFVHTKDAIAQSRRQDDHLGLRQFQ
ncbi:MAG: zf-HC2 domain-containing protein [Blastocatellia bacterium]